MHHWSIQSKQWTPTQVPRRRISYNDNLFTPQRDNDTITCTHYFQHNILIPWHNWQWKCDNDFTSSIHRIPYRPITQIFIGCWRGSSFFPVLSACGIKSKRKEQNHQCTWTTTATAATSSDRTTTTTTIQSGTAATSRTTSRKAIITSCH